MRPKNKPQNQLNFLAPTLKEQLNPHHELYLLAEAIDWDYFDREFSKFYSDKGRPAHPIRLMTSLLILKSIYNLSDERLVEQHWEMNAYFQYLVGLLFNVGDNPVQRVIWFTFVSVLEKKVLRKY